jgi:hypothetical protein
MVNPRFARFDRSLLEVVAKSTPPAAATPSAAWLAAAL